jgi:dolichol-phosphate mannosyltransferase
MQPCLIVIATYNEIENLPKLIARIRELHPSVEVLVIDDGSPDGTGVWVSEFSRQNAWCHLILRSGKLGLGSATLTGFRWALERSYSWVVTMDADFSHHPDELSRLLNASPTLAETKAPTVADDSCIVIGSRYVPGGLIEGWPWQRRLASRWINRFARWWLRLSTTDNSGAYRRYPVALLRRLPLDRVRNQGYGYLEEILVLARQHGASFHEVPITFRDRTRGRSKINFREAWLAIGTIALLGLRQRAGWSNT